MSPDPLLDGDVLGGARSLLHFSSLTPVFYGFVACPLVGGVGEDLGDRGMARHFHIGVES